MVTGTRRKNGLYHILDIFSRLNNPELSTYFINFDELFPFPTHERNYLNLYN